MKQLDYIEVYTYYKNNTKNIQKIAKHYNTDESTIRYYITKAYNKEHKMDD